MKIQVKLETGAWQYLIDSPEGYRCSIYPNHAIDGSQIFEVQRKRPDYQLRVVNDLTGRPFSSLFQWS
jgi:Ser/Thr protein kinase RdoA (MazF antagonist)